MRAIWAFISASLWALAPAAAQDKHPDWSAQYTRIGGAQFDPAKPPVRGQQVPFNAQAQAYFDKINANRREGGLLDNFSANCLPLGMPRVLIDYEMMDLFVTPSTTYMWFTESNELRRIYTDGRKWPDQIKPSFIGTSIGEWRDEGGTGKFNTLLVETRGFLGPRTYDSSGAHLHADNQSVIKEKITADPQTPGRLKNEITIIDNALTKPREVTRFYQPVKQKGLYTETICALDNTYIIVGEDNYFVSGDGYLMPAKKDQGPPDLRHFNAANANK